MRKIVLFFFYLSSLVIWPSLAVSQNFNGAYRVNSEVITHYEIDQMQKLLEVFGEPSQTSYDKAVEFLINHRLLARELELLGFEIDDGDVRHMIESFAEDGDAEKLKQNLQAKGIDEETLITFARARIMRQAYAGAKGLDTTVDDERKTNNINTIPDQVTPTVSLSEIVLPYAEYGGRIPTRFAYKQIVEALGNGESFEGIARQKSRSATAPNGGIIPDIPVAGLNPETQSHIEGLNPGQISPPIETEGAIIILKLNGYGEHRASLPRNPKLTYIDLFMNADNGLGSSLKAASDLMSEVQTCEHAEALLGDYPGSGKHEDVALNSLSSGLSLALSRMETGTRALYEREDGTSVLYLCAKNVEVPEELQEQVDRGSENAVIESKVDGILRDLRASASIVKLD